jgi:chitinase
MKSLKSFAFVLSLLFIITGAHAATKLTYDWQAPYSGANTLTIYNDSDETVNINELVFSTSAMINGSPYGSLPVWGSAFKEDPDHKGTYILTFPVDKAFQLAAKTSANLNITYAAAYGPLSVGMTVENVTVDGQKLAFHGVCSECTDPAPGYRITGYYNNWDQYARQYDATQIPVANMNTINYAFLNVKADGHIALIDTNADYKQLVTIANLEKKYPYLQTFLSFGGWTLSDNFSGVMADPAKRHIFEDEAIAAMQEAGFNGIDIDWEYPVIGAQGKDVANPHPEDAINLGLFATELRAKLNAYEKIDGKKYYISLAVGAGVDKIKLLSNEQWQVVANAIDYLNLMAYDFHGAFDYRKGSPYSIADFHSAMDLDAQDPTVQDPTLKEYNVRDAVKHYLAAGFKPKQIVVGMPIYGRMVNVSTLGDDHYGLYQALLANIPAGQYDDWSSGATGMFDYSCIVTAISGGQCKGNTPAGLHLAPVESHQKYADHSGSQWAYTDANQIITFDDAAGISRKSAWVKQEGLGGAMFWSLSGDLPSTDERSLIRSAHNALK